MGETWVRGRLVSPAALLDDGVVMVDGGRIRYVGPAAPDLGREDTGRPPTVVEAPPDGFVLPGLVDLHNHGGGGRSFGEAGPAAAAVAAGEHLRHGTTSVVAGTVTDDPGTMVAAVARVAAAVEAGEVRGLHVEGPFLSPLRCGAQDPEHLRVPDVGLTRDLLAAGAGHLRVMTLAPELPGADEVERLLLEAGVVPAVGHTEAPFRLVRRTLARTASALGRPGLVTHLFNAMPSLHHREPGPVGAALAAATEAEAVVELVADGVHVADETVRTVFALLGADRVALVTDAMAAAGMPDGEYSLGPRRVVVSGGVARVGGPDEGALAGGTAHLLDVVRRCVDAGISVVDAVTAASGTPAGLLGLDDVGVLEAGARADLVVTDRELRPLQVMLAGEWLPPI